MNTNLPTKDDTELGDHIRRTLFAVAGTIELETNELETSGAATPQPAPRNRRISGRNIAIAAALAIMSLGVLGWKALSQGDIERIPVEAALVSGVTEGYEWWLIPSAAIEGHSNPCDVPFPGVEMVSGARNRPGEQWSTGGVNYGEHKPRGTRTATDATSGAFTYDCTNPASDFDAAAWLSDPTLHEFSYIRLGRGDDPDSPLAAFIAMHPSIDHIDVIVDGRVINTVATVAMADEPDGARYAGFTVPSDVCSFRLDYLSGSQIVTTDHRTVC